MPHSVSWLEHADADLDALYEWIAEQSGSEVALRYVLRIAEAGERLADFPNRGSPRDTIRSGLRSIPFDRTATIYYEVGPSEVRIVRVIHARRDIASAFADD